MRAVHHHGVGRWAGIGLVLLASACGGSVSPSATKAPAARATLSPREIAARANPSVVLIQAEGANGHSLGTGFVAGSDGRIATNLHVVEGARDGQVVFPDGRRLRIVGITVPVRHVDLALVHVEAEGLHALPLGSSVHAGDHIVAIGNPGGLDHTISDGLVSKVREVGDVSLLQFSAPISPGSSGGPLLDDRGEVVGLVVSTMVNAQNLNFGVPVSELKTVLASNAAPLSMTEFSLTSRPHLNALGADEVAAQAQQCRQGKGRVCDTLGQRYRFGKGVERDDAKAVEYFNRSCEASELLGCTDLGAMFRIGQGVSKDLKRAVGLFERSCKGGERFGCWHLGDLQVKGEGLAKNPAQGVKHIEQACDAGAHAACTSLGDLYDVGKHVPKRADRAASFFQRGCDGQQGRACTKLGTLAREGRGIPQDDAKAASLFTRGCAERDVEGCAHLGKALVDGRGIAEDRKRGVDLLRYSCKHGSGWSCDALRTVAPSP